MHCIAVLTEASARDDEQAQGPKIDRARLPHCRLPQCKACEHKKSSSVGAYVCEEIGAKQVPPLQGGVGSGPCGENGDGKRSVSMRAVQ